MQTGTIVQLADYGAFMVENPEDPGQVDAPDSSNGLVYAGPHGGAAVETGIYMGPVRVSWSSGDPVHANLDDWEDVAQVSVRPIGGVLAVRGFMESGEDGDSPNLALDPEAEHMLRCYARGRDTARHDSLNAEAEPVEEYHLELWLRRPGDEPAVLKLTSEFGKDLVATEPS
jgi:hypothetical protein